MKRILLSSIFGLIFLVGKTQFTKVNSAGNIDTKTSVSTFSASPGFTPTNGNLLVAIFSFDNIGTTTDGDKGDVTSVVQAGTTWIKAVEFTNVQGGAGSGATVSIWYTIYQTNGNNVTVNLNGNVTARCWQYIEFSFGSGNTIGLTTSGTLANDGADAGSITLSGLTSREYAFIRGCAIENNTATGTASTNYTNTSAATGTTGGGAAGNMWIQSEYRIVTGTSSTTDPTTGSADIASAMIGFYEIPPATPHTRRITIIQ